MPYTDLTSTSSVRSVLGVSEKELRDDVLIEPIYSTILSIELRAIYSDILTLFDTVQAIDPRTAAQQQFLDLMQTYASYNVALQCCISVRMFAPKIIQDSKSKLERQDDPYKNLRTDIGATLGFLRDTLLTLLPDLVPGFEPPAKVARVLVVATPLAVDPVTG